MLCTLYTCHDIDQLKNDPAHSHQPQPLIIDIFNKLAWQLALQQFNYEGTPQLRLQAARQHL